MGYVDKVLRPEEHVVIRSKIHWIRYRYAILWTAIALISSLYFQNFLYSVGIFLVAALFIVEAWFDRWITEIVVTNRRIIYKRGFISRHSAEMNVSQVESVTVNQSILGRVLGFGTIHVMGTGSGIEHIHHVQSPIALRNTILAR